MTDSGQFEFRLAFWNCENLFLRLELLKSQDVDLLTESEWQSLTKSKEPNKPLHKVRWQARTIEQMDADLLCLAEVGGRESIDNLKHYFLKNQYLSLMVEGNSDRGIDLGFLLNKRRCEKIELISHRLRPIQFTYPLERPLNDGGISHLFSRDCLELRLFELGRSEPRLVVLLVHLKSKLDPLGIDPRGFLRRQAEAKALVEIYNDIRGNFPTAGIAVVGDFNAQGRRAHCEEELKIIYSHSDLQEVMDICDTPTNKAASQITFPKGPKPIGVQIDHIFVSPNLAPKLDKTKCRIEPFLTELGQPLPYVKSLEQRQALPSDHYPICATFLNL